MKRVNWKLLVALAMCLVPGTGCVFGGRTDPGPAPYVGTQTQAAKIAYEARQASKRGDTERAIELYKQALAESPGFFAAANNLGILLMEQGKHYDAVEAFKLAADVAPTDPRPLENIGLAYLSRGWAEPSLVSFLKALDRDPHSMRALRGAADAGSRLGVADQDALDRVSLALLLEQDPRWVPFFQRERIRIKGQIERMKARERDSI